MNEPHDLIAGLIVATDSELAQAYSQGYQDGRRVAGEDAARYQWLRNSATFGAKHDLRWYLPRNLDGDKGKQLDAALDAEINRAEQLAKVAQPQPATKGE